MRNYVLYATSLIVIKMLDKERAVVDIIFCLLSICVLDLENSKNINFSPVETPRLTWHNLFAHRSTRSAVSSQIDQNAPGQPSVDRKSKLVKIITKQHFSCFYIKSELLRDFLSILTKFDLRLTLGVTKNPKFWFVLQNGLGPASLQRLWNSISNNYSWAKIGVEMEWSTSACFLRP